MPGKRLIVACDGTWTDSDNGFVRDSWLPWKTGGKLAVESNVTRICRALKPRSDDGVPQVVYYQAGLGSQNNAYSYFVGGYLGSGISENIREAYAFLCNNYEDGDDIILIGFSRGAFTARSIGALICEAGLLTRKGLSSFYPTFKDWENQVNPDYKPQYGSDAWPVDRPKFSDPDYAKQLAQDGLTRPHIPVKAIGVWDTVGTLGIPELDIAGFKLFANERREYSFINTEVPSNVEYAFHALALDEERKAFFPTVWECPKPGSPTKLKELKQCWFPGVHSSIGGGYQDTNIADITLAWMMTQLHPFLSFDSSYMLLQQGQNKAFYAHHSNWLHQVWAMGQIKKSDSGALNTITGRQVRTPGSYYAVDPMTGKPTDRKLTNTCEFVHPSARYRTQQKGPGLATSDTDPGKGTYEPEALEGWTYHEASKTLDNGLDVENRGLSAWNEYGKWVVKHKDGSHTVIVEEKIENGTQEMALLDAWGPSVAQQVLQ